jgi:hypothetical protein
MEGFLPISELQNRSFYVSLAGGISVAVAIIVSAALYLASTKIIVDPIAEVNLSLSAPSNSELRPISDLLDGYRSDNFKIAWLGYAANLKDLCTAGYITNTGQQAVVLTQSSNTTSASTLQLRPSLCEKLKDSKSSDTIFIAADRPFKDVASEKFIATDSGKK